MSGADIGQTGGVHGAQLTRTGEAQAEELSLSDLMLQTMLDRADMLDSQIRSQAITVKTQNEQIKQLNQIYSKLSNHKTQPTNVVTKPTWSTDKTKTPQEILLDNGNKLVFEGKNQAWSIVDAEGNSTRIWGDPHVSEGDSKGRWDFQSDSTFILKDGTKITVKTTPKGSKGRTDGNVYTDSLIITKGNQSITVTGIADDKPVIGETTLDGGKLDRDTNDGHIFRMGDQADDWIYEGEEVDSGFVVRDGVTQEAERVEGDTADNLFQQGVLTDSDKALLKKLGVTVYDNSGTGMLTAEEITNLQTQIKDMRDSVSSLSNIELTKLDSYNKKYTQSLDLASTFMKSQFEQAKSIIRNT